MYKILNGAATDAAILMYGDTVAVSIAAATTTPTPTTTAPIPVPFAVVAQRRAPIAGDMGARSIYGICMAIGASAAPSQHIHHPILSSMITGR